MDRIYEGIADTKVQLFSILASCLIEAIGGIGSRELTTSHAISLRCMNMSIVRCPIVGSRGVNRRGSRDWRLTQIWTQVCSSHNRLEEQVRASE